MFDSRTILSDAVDRAAMAGGIYPTESHSEATVKRGLAMGLAYAARWLAPEMFKAQDTHLQPARQLPE